MEQEGLKYVLTARGGPFVVTRGMTSMLQLPVDNQDTHLMVRYVQEIIAIPVTIKVCGLDMLF